jgi:Outer membrane protein beta-barrel domain
MKKLLLTYLLFSASAYAWAQKGEGDEKNTQEKAPLAQESQQYVYKDHLEKPRITSVKFPNYGSLVIDSRLNFLRDCPPEMNSKDWRARIAGISVYYNIHLGRSHFTISPGIGLSFEGYTLQKDRTLLRYPTSTVFKNEGDSSGNVLSALEIRYLDFCLLEVRFNANSKWPKENFFIALGGKVGVLWKAYTTVRYERHDEIKKCNNWETFNLNKVRYGICAKLGWGRFGLCYMHTLSSLFEEGRGPGATDTKPCSLGISIDLL